MSNSISSTKLNTNLITSTTPNIANNPNIDNQSNPQVLKNVQVSKMFGVSEPTVINWIKSALEQKNRLTVAENKGKWCIVNSPHNLSEMQFLSDKGRKYRNKVPIKKTDISHLNDLRQDHLLELLQNLEHNHQIPFKFIFLKQRRDFQEKYFNPDVSVDNHFLQAKLLVQDSQQTWSGHVKRDASLNIICTSYASPYIYRSFLTEIGSKRRVDNLRFVSLSKDEAEVFHSQNQVWLDKLGSKSKVQMIISDIDNDPAWSIFQKDTGQFNLLSLLGDVFYDISFFTRVVKNVSRCMSAGDFIITNILLNNPSYQTNFDCFLTDSVQNSVRSILEDLNLKQGEDCEIEYCYEDIDPTAKWFARRGTKKMFLNIHKEIHLHFDNGQVSRDIIWPKGSQIELANWKLWEGDFFLEAAKLGFNFVTFNTNMEQTEAFVLMKKI
jgi:hypothetical protein